MTCGEHSQQSHLCVLKVNYTSEDNRQTQKKSSDFWLPKKTGEGKGELDEGSQKVQTPSYKISKYQACNIQHEKYSQHCSMLYKKVNF